MSNNAIRILPETLRSVAFGSITGSYTALGTPLANPSHVIILQNGTNQIMFFSWDGTNNHQVLFPSGQLVLDVSSNSALNGGAFLIAKGTQFYVKYASAPTSGSVYLSTFYGYSPS